MREDSGTQLVVVVAERAAGDNRVLTTTDIEFVPTTIGHMRCLTQRVKRRCHRHPVKSRMLPVHLSAAHCSRQWRPPVKGSVFHE